MSNSPSFSLGALFEQLETNPPATEQAISQMLTDIGIDLPQDYLDFLRIANGAQGTGPNLWVILDPAEQIHDRTIRCGAPEFAPGLIVVGSDGLGNVLGIDTRRKDTSTMRYVRLDPVWLELDTESVQNNCDSFFALLHEIAIE